MMTLSPETIGGIIGLGVTVGTALFHIVLYIGKISNKVERHEDRINAHEEDIRELKGLGV